MALWLDCLPLLTQVFPYACYRTLICMHYAGYFSSHIIRRNEKSGTNKSSGFNTFAAVILSF